MPLGAVGLRVPYRAYWAIGVGFDAEAWPISDECSDGLERAPTLEFHTFGDADSHQTFAVNVNRTTARHPFPPRRLINHPKIPRSTDDVGVKAVTSANFCRHCGLSHEHWIVASM